MRVPEGKKNGPIILVEIDGEDILRRNKYPDDYERYPWMTSADITLLTANVFDTRTYMWSDNSLYRGNKGDYIKKGGKRYYIKDFV